MDYRQTLLVLLAVLLCSSQVLTETPTEATLVQTPSETSTEAIPKSTPQGNVSDLLKMMNKLNHPIIELTKTVIRLDEMNSRIMTRLDEMNSESVKRFEEINSTMMTRLDEMFSLFDKLDKKTQKKSEEMDNKLIKRLDEMNAETVNRFNEMDLRVKSLVLLTVLLCSSQGLMETPTEATLVQTPLETSARLQPQEGSLNRKEKQFVLFTNEEKTWQGAYDDCMNRGMSLASIESEEENNKVVSLLRTTGKPWFWLSGSDLGHTGRYVWKSTGRDVTYNQWRQGQPDYRVYSNGLVDHCMFVYTGNMQWNDWYCSDLHQYICQHWV